MSYIEAHKNELKIPLEEVIAKFEAKYGSLDQYRLVDDRAQTVTIDRVAHRQEAYGK